MATFCFQLNTLASTGKLLYHKPNPWFQLGMTVFYGRFLGAKKLLQSQQEAGLLPNSLDTREVEKLYCMTFAMAKIKCLAMATNV